MEDPTGSGSNENKDNVFVNSLHASKCCEEMAKFWRKSQLCDVNLIVLDHLGTPTACVPAHKVVLASSIPFFAAMFGIRMKESSETEVSLHGYDSSAVKCLVEYAYTGKVEINQYNAQHVLVTADKFTLPNLVSFCAKFIERETVVSNCLSVREFAHHQNLADLHKYAEDFVIQNFSSVSKEEEFLQLPVKEVIELVKSDDILVGSEEDVYNAVTNWIRHDISTRKEHADELYDYVRFPITSKRFLDETVPKNELLLTEKISVYLKDAFEYHLNPAAIIFSNPKKTQPRRSVQGIICLVGGVSDSGDTLNSFTLYNSHEKEWKEGPVMNFRRSRLGVAILQGELYAIGGYDLGYSLTLCEKFSPSENRWKEISPLNSARRSLAVVPVGNGLFAMGGYTGSVHLQSVEIYNPSNDEWVAGPPLLEPRSELSAVYQDQFVYAIGGSNSKGDLRSVERFDLMNRKWECITSMNAPRSGGGKI